jgi:hypothetical protein
VSSSQGRGRRTEKGQSQEGASPSWLAECLAHSRCRINAGKLQKQMASSRLSHWLVMDSDGTKQRR